MSVNKMVILGTLGKDPKINTTKAGKKIANFSVATNEKWKDKAGEPKEITTWHNVVVYSEGLVKLVESYLKKGSKVYIEAPLKKRKYLNKEGVEVETCEIVLQGFNSILQLLDSKERCSYEKKEVNGNIAPESDFESDQDN